MRRAVILGLVVGIGGALATVAALHLYADHVRVDQIWQLELNRAAAAQATQPK